MIKNKRRIKKILAQLLIFFANFSFSKQKRHVYRTRIKQLLLVPSVTELDYWNNIMDNKETLQYIIKNQCSISRYGDGEIGYMLYDDFQHFFQSYNKNLQKKLKDILMNPIPSCLISLPEWLYKPADNEFNVSFQAKYWYDFMKFKIENIIYGSAMCFMPSSFLDNNVEQIKQIWNNKDIVIVTGKNSTFVWIEELFGNTKSHKFIYSKAVDAFSEYDKLICEISQLSKTSVILIALGLTSTVLTYELSKLGYQAIDIGHITNHYLTVAKGIKAIDFLRLEGKYIDGETDIRTLINNFAK